jgi:hypothetical protein
MSRAPRRPRDTNQLAKLIVDISTGDAREDDPDAGKDPLAVERGRMGGIVGGQARKKALSKQRRKEIAKPNART